ncbi:putative uncharacterized protein [Blautia hydrogenotrophica CAG:147]|nr:putative uncharacterized protein [Blautia hydrogenotrophica CAG:147]
MGDIASSQNFVTYFVLIASLGIAPYGVRILAQKRNNINLCNRAFTELFIINGISTLVSMLIYFIVIIWFGSFSRLESLNLIFSILIVFNIFNIDWVYQAMEEYRYIAYRSFVIKIISLFMLLVFVKSKDDIYVYAWIVCFGTVGNYFLNMLYSKKYVFFNFHKLSFRQHFIPIIVFFASIVAIELYSLIDVTMLTYFTDSASVGYYTNASKIVKTFTGTITAIGAVLLPRLSIYYAKEEMSNYKSTVEKMLKLILILTVPATIGICFVAHDIVIIMFGEEFFPSSQTIQTLSFLIIFMTLSGGIGAQILQTTNNERSYLTAVCEGAIINIFLNSILIGPFRQNGAAIASVITEAVVAVMMLVKCKPIVQIQLGKRFAFDIASAVLFMSFGLMICQMIDSNMSTIFRLSIEILTGMSIYFGILLLRKNNETMNICKKIIQKIKK